MINEKMKTTYNEWVRLATEDPDVVKELEQMSKDEESLTDAFYKELSFGTSGLRGMIGAGPNQINIYTVGKASQGLVQYVKQCFPKEQWKVAIGYDPRMKSDMFAKRAASVFAAGGIQVYIYPELMPVPCVSFAIRYLKCAVGVMITASHNPYQYNGYKVYGSDGCQITTEAAGVIYSEMQKVDTFLDVQAMDFQRAVSENRVVYIDQAVTDAFVEAVKNQSPLKGETVERDMKIVYSPLNGAGAKPVMRVLMEAGYTNITIVKEQEHPDSHFTTCPYPNPEIKEAMQLGMEYASRERADLLLATDPDCDRIGIAVKNAKGEYILLSANETGILLLDFICSMHVRHNSMPKDPIAFKNIVTTDLAERIASRYGVKMINVLSGFKYIGEHIGRLEKEGKKDSFVFGFEESCGYLSGTYVRDKDGVLASLLVCEMCAWYQSQGSSLYNRLQHLYDTYGYCLDTLHSFTFPGASGFAKMQRIMAFIRAEGKKNLVIGGKKVSKVVDYAEGVEGLPSSDVVKFVLEDDSSVVLRPSGTEPKLKLYLSVISERKETAYKQEQQILNDMSHYMK